MFYILYIYLYNIYPTGDDISTTPRHEGDPIDLGDGKEHGGREP